MDNPFTELSMLSTRRLLTITMLVVAPVLAACSTPTGTDDDPPANPPADSTGFDSRPWG